MFLLPTIILMVFLISGAHSSKNAEESMIPVWVVSGGRASLPCVPKPKVKGDQPMLVLWYRRFSSSLPIYSYDARVGKFSNGVRWWDEMAVGRRAYFVPSNTPELVLEPTVSQDQDIYTCRIDYRLSVSTTTLVNLTVVVPPGPPTVIWRGREMVGTVGPLQENQMTEITCRSVGGRPAPSLTWWNEGRELPLLHSNSSLDPVTGTSVVEATLSVTAKRELQGGSLTCYARTPTHLSVSEEAMIPSRTASVYLNITLSPIEVRILGPDEVMATSGSTINIVCRALGSHPPADLSWWRGIRSLEPHVTHAIGDGGNITTATLTIAVTGEDDGATVTCTGSNPGLPNEPLSDRRKLIVYYEPIVNLALGKPLEAENIKEEDDVYFECNIKSNPKFHRIEWYHNSKEISQNMAAGVVISRQSLVIRSVLRSHSGSYTCVATNAQGRSTSNTLHLTVQHTPICVGTSGQERTQGAARGTEVKAKCRVEAEPSSNLAWSWVRKRTDGSEEILSPDKYVIEGLTSTLTVVPDKREDYGRLLCRVKNDVGNQKVPCVVNLVPAGPPDVPTNCSAIPINAASLVPSLAVSCIEGFDGGLPQNFLLEAWQDGLILVNISSEFPEWVVSGMESGRGVLLNIVGYNARGRSDPVTLRAQAIAAPNRAAPVQETPAEVPPIVGAALGVVGVILIFILVGVAILRRAHSRHRKPVIVKALSSSEGLNPDVVQSIKRLDVLPSDQEEHSEEEIAMFAYSDQRYSPDYKEPPEEEATLQIREESIGNEVLPEQVEIQHVPYNIERQRLNLSHDQSEDSGVSESESDNEMKVPEGDERSSGASCTEGDSDRGYFPVSSDRAIRSTPTVSPASSSAESPSRGGELGYQSPYSRTNRTMSSPPTRELREIPEGYRQNLRKSHDGSPLTVSLKDMPYDPSSALGLSKLVPSVGRDGLSPVEVVCLAVTPTGMLTPVATEGQIPSKMQTIHRVPKSNPNLESSEYPKREPAKILSPEMAEIGVPVTLYKADNGELLLLPRRTDCQGTGVPLSTAPVYKIAGLPKATEKKSLDVSESRTKETDSRSANKDIKKLPKVDPRNKGLSVKHPGRKEYISSPNPDVCRRESSV